MSAQDYMMLLELLIYLVDKYGKAETNSQIAKALSTLEGNLK
jgi:hypothetical protein